MYENLYPPENRFLVKFVGWHLLTTGKWSTSDQKRYRLADSADQALRDVMTEIKNPRYWPPGFHEVRAMPIIIHCPQEITYNGYARFGGANDIRRKTLEEETMVLESGGDFIL